MIKIKYIIDTLNKLISKFTKKSVNDDKQIYSVPEKYKKPIPICIIKGNNIIESNIERCGNCDNIGVWVGFGGLNSEKEDLHLCNEHNINVLTSDEPCEDYNKKQSIYR